VCAAVMSVLAVEEEDSLLVIELFFFGIEKYFG